MKTVEKKIFPTYFQEVFEGKKTFELRLNDFDVAEGDTLVLKEWNPDTRSYTGRELSRKVGFVGKWTIDDLTVFWPKEDILQKGVQLISLKDNESETEAWVHSYLLGEGNNKALSDGLKMQIRRWVGPTALPLSSIPRIVGPEKGLEYFEDETSWNKRVTSMKMDIERGWNPPPLIVEYRSGILSLRDGNHRHAALVAAGRTSHPVIIWFNLNQDLEKYLESTR